MRQAESNAFHQQIVRRSGIRPAHTRPFSTSGASSRISYARHGRLTSFPAKLNVNSICVIVKRYTNGSATILFSASGTSPDCTHDSRRFEVPSSGRYNPSHRYSACFRWLRYSANAANPRQHQRQVDRNRRQRRIQPLALHRLLLVFDRTPVSPVPPSETAASARSCISGRVCAQRQRHPARVAGDREHLFDGTHDSKLHAQFRPSGFLPVNVNR